MSAPRFQVVAVELYERPVKLRMPFRFGVVTLTAAPQAFVRARIRLEDGREGWGAGAEILAPKWFDKNLALSNEDNFDQLRLALALARDAYLDRGARTAFGHFAAHYREVIEAGARHDLNPLVACFGPAQLDRAILDALCRLERMSFYEAMQGNFAGIAPAELAPDLAGFDIDAFLARLQPADSIAARHTVGLVDVIAGHPRAGERRPARVARRGRGDVRPHLVQAESRREGRRGRRAADRDRGGAGRERDAVPCLARRQRAVRRSRRAAGAARPDERPAAAGEARGGDRLHRAADQPQARARARRLRRVAYDAGDRRRIGRGPRRLPAGESARLLGCLVQDVQGTLQVDFERGALHAVEHARAPVLHDRRGSDDAGRASRCSRTSRWSTCSA